MNLGNIGFGVYKITDENKMYIALKTALDTGYNLIDTATYYNNEKFIGNFLKEYKYNSNLIITSKIWPTEMSYDDTLRSFERSYKLLNGKLDILLLHWPHPEKFLDAYRALERLYNEKVIKKIGVSNFKIHHLEKLKNNSNIKPFINQIELHPKFFDEELLEYNKKEGIITQSWSPIAKARYLDEPLLVELSKKYNVSSSNIILNWHIQKGIHPIPKSENPKRIIENFNSQNFVLSKEDIKKIDSLNVGLRIGMDSDEFPYE